MRMMTDKRNEIHHDKPENVKVAKKPQAEIYQNVQIARLEEENSFLRSIITSLIDTILDR